MSAIKKMWKTIKSWANDNAEHYQAVAIADNDAQAIKPHRDYFRVWLNEMFLSDRVDWFQTWYPAVNSSVQLKFGDRPSPITLSHIAHAPQKALGEGVLLNFPVTDLLPYRGGIVEIEAALLGMKGSNSLDAAIKVLESFSGLVGAPLVQTLDVAGKVADGIDQLLGSTNGQIHLGYHNGYASEGGGDAVSVLKEGHVAVILATVDDVAPNRLSIVNNRLLYDAEPLTGYDYMLFSIERRQERDDWRLTTISEHLNKAIEAIVMGRDDEARAYRQAAIVSAFQSDDLSVIDRRRVVKAIKDELNEVENIGLLAIPDEPRDLEKVREERAMSFEDAEILGPMTLDEALS